MIYRVDPNGLNIYQCQVLIFRQREDIHPFGFNTSVNKDFIYTYLMGLLNGYEAHEQKGKR